MYLHKPARFKYKILGSLEFCSDTESYVEIVLAPSLCPTSCHAGFCLTLEGPHTHTYTFSPHVHSPNDTVHSLKGVLGKTLRQTLETGLGPSGQGTQVPRYPKCGTERGSWALNEHIAVAPRFLCPLGRLWLEEGQSGTPNVQGPELGLLLPSARCEFISSTAHTEQQAQAHPRQCGGRSLWICSRSGSLSFQPRSYRLQHELQSLRS